MTNAEKLIERLLSENDKLCKSVIFWRGKADEIAAAAKSLAIAYHAYLEALDKSDRSGIVTWGTLLLRAQSKTGCVMLTNVAEILSYHEPAA